MESQIKPDPISKSGPVSLSEGAIRIVDDATFGPDGAEACERFLARVFEVAEVQSVTVDRSTRAATIRHQVDGPALPGFLGSLAASLRSQAGSSASPTLPDLPSCPTFSVHRHGSMLTTWRPTHREAGRLRLRHEALRGDDVLAARIKQQLRGIPGVRIVEASGATGHLLIRFDPSLISESGLIGLAEASLREPEPRSTSTLARVEFGMANLCLVVATAGEFLLPILRPASAVLLVATNLRTFKAALVQVREKRLGLPVLYMAIIATTLATGQFVASALMTWFFRFWHRRFRIELASEQGRLLKESSKGALRARLVTPAGVEVLVKVGRVRPGDRLAVAAGELVLADGRVAAGEGIVDERNIRGLEGISRKRAGDALSAGSRVLAGSFQFEVTAVGDRTRGASIRRVLLAATNPTAGHSAPTKRSEAYADRAVGPTLATAGFGLLAGDLMTVGAILRPDYATGPGLAVPLETLRNVALCARLGVVARDPEALERLARVDLFVLQDQPALAKTEVEVARIETRMPEPVLLRYAAGAFRHLVDDRASALLQACRARQVPVLNLDPVDFGRGVAVAHDSHVIRVRDAHDDAPPTGPLVVEIDGTIVGLIEFAATARLEASTAIDRIRRTSHVPFALVSDRGEAAVADLARSLGVEMYRGDFRAEDTANFLAACRGRGLKVAFIGDCRAHARAEAESYVSISYPGGADLEGDPAGLLMQQARLSALADLHVISRTHATRVKDAHEFMLVPNLLCVAGAFFFGFTGMTAVMLSNLGTLGLYRRVSHPLRGLDPLVPLGTGQPRRAG